MWQNTEANSWYGCNNAQAAGCETETDQGSLRGALSIPVVGVNSAQEDTAGPL